MKKELIIISVLGLVIFASGCLNLGVGNQTGNNNQASNIPTENFNNGQFSFNYPSIWKINDTRSDDSITFVDVGTSGMYNTDNLEAAGAIIIKFSESSPTSASEYKNTLVQALGTTAGTKTDTGTVSIDGVTGNVETYEGTNDKGHITQIKMITWEKNSSSYLMACIVRGADLGNTLDSQKANFDVIINSFQTQ
ncbi:MAG: hypothetical protein Kow0019_12680 [Methanobacteriaceae archaeon]